MATGMTHAAVEDQPADRLANGSLRAATKGSRDERREEAAQRGRVAHVACGVCREIVRARRGEEGRRQRGEVAGPVAGLEAGAR